MKNLIPVSEETAKKMAFQFFGFNAPCEQAEVNCKKAWWEFAVGKITLLIPNFYNVKKDKCPYGCIILQDTTIDSENPFDDECGKIYYINGFVQTASKSINRVAGAGVKQCIFMRAMYEYGQTWNIFFFVLSSRIGKECGKTARAQLLRLSRPSSKNLKNGGKNR